MEKLRVSRSPEPQRHPVPATAQRTPVSYVSLCLKPGALPPAGEASERQLAVAPRPATQTTERNFREGETQASSSGAAFPPGDGV